METLGDWLQSQIDTLGWRQAELARRAGVRPATLNRIINGSRRMGPDVARAIAHALAVDEDAVFRRAGLLPAVPDDTAETAEAARIIGRLREVERRLVLAMLRGLERTLPPAVDDPWAQAILDELVEVPGEQRQVLLGWVRQLREHTGLPALQVIGEESAEIPPPQTEP